MAKINNGWERERIDDALMYSILRWDLETYFLIIRLSVFCCSIVYLFIFIEQVYSSRCAFCLFIPVFFVQDTFFAMCYFWPKITREITHPIPPECPFYGWLVRGKQAGKEETTQRPESWVGTAGAIATAAAASSALRYRERRRNLGWRPRDTQVGVAPIPTRRTGVAAIWNYIRTSRCRGYIPLSSFLSPDRLPRVRPYRIPAAVAAGSGDDGGSAWRGINRKKKKKKEKREKKKKALFLSGERALVPSRAAVDRTDAAVSSRRRPISLVITELSAWTSVVRVRRLRPYLLDLTRRGDDGGGGPVERREPTHPLFRSLPSTFRHPERGTCVPRSSLPVSPFLRFFSSRVRSLATQPLPIRHRFTPFHATQIADTKELISLFKKKKWSGKSFLI